MLHRVSVMLGHFHLHGGTRLLITRAPTMVYPVVSNYVSRGDAPPTSVEPMT